MRVADEDVLAARGSDGRLINPGRAATRMSPSRVEAMGDPACDDNVRAVFFWRSGGIQLLHMSAIGHRGLAKRRVVRLDPLILLLAVVRRRDGKRLGEDTMPRAGRANLP
mgnify:CR=1 FL=1